MQGARIECTGGANLPQYCPSALTAARGVAPMLIGQPCNPAVSQALGTTHRRCACSAHREGIECVSSPGFVFELLGLIKFLCGPILVSRTGDEG